MGARMRVGVLRGVRDVAVEERPVPEPGPGEVLVRVGSVGVCGSDVHYYEHGRIGSHVVDAPLVLGHEAGGVVVAVGDGVRRGSGVRGGTPGSSGQDLAVGQVLPPGDQGIPTRSRGLAVGQRVSIEPGVPCRSCRQCLAGRYNLCPEVKFFATPPYDGAFAEYVVMPEAFVFAVPDSISDDAAGLIEPLSVGVWACRRGGVSPETRVLITGAGPIGLIAAQVARAYGAPEVAVTDVNPHRLALTASLGLTAVDTGQTPLADWCADTGFEPDVLLECSGHPRATWDAVGTVARAGRVVLVGMGGDEVRLPLSYLQDRELVLTGAFRYANTWPTAIGLAASGRVDLDGMVTGHYGLDDVEGALTAARRDPTVMKAVVRPGE